MKKSNYRNGNETLINYYNHITAGLDKYKLNDFNILRTETLLFINNDEEHFLIEVDISHQAPKEEIEKFFNIMEQEILPGYMEAFYNVKDIKVKLFDESGKTEEIIRVFENKAMQIEEKSEEQEI